jgi:lambda family phage portal protein
MNVIDSIIGTISPKAGFNRTRYRFASNAIKEGQRKFDAAAVTRRTEGWRATGASPNNETIAVLSRLRDRSRELVRNNAYAKRAIQVIKNNTIGTGIRPTPSIASPENLKKIKDLWWRWAETPECDWNGKETFYGLQKMVIAAVAQDGEVIIRKRRANSKNGLLPVKLQVCEADQIDDSKENATLPDGGWIIQGVEFDKNGKLVAYWLYDRHPGDSLSLYSTRVPSSEVLHVYLQDRPGQVRGVPWSTSIMIKLRDFDDFEDAQLMQQKVAACFAVIITSDDTGGTIVSNNSTDSGLSERVEPGIIQHAKPGEAVNVVNPPTTTGQDSFSRKVLQAIAAGYGISYESLTGDLSNVNFSSGRMGWLEMHRNIQEWQARIMITQFCDPVWKWFTDAAKISGKVQDSDIIADWTPPRREMIDPVKEINGLSQLVQNGFDSWQDVVRQLGYDPDLLLEQMKEDIDRFDKSGLKLACDFRQDLLKKNVLPQNTPQNAK